MKAIEFDTELENYSSIGIPENIQKEFKLSDNRNVREIVLIRENDMNEKYTISSISC
jgi:hypothetical protein